MLSYHLVKGNNMPNHRIEYRDKPADAWSLWGQLVGTLVYARATAQDLLAQDRTPDPETGKSPAPRAQWRVNGRRVQMPQKHKDERSSQDVADSA